MSRNPKAVDPRHFPTKGEILAFLANAKGKVGKREIAREFGLGPAAKIALKRVLKELSEEGALERRRGALHRADRLPPVVLAEVTGRDADGDAIARPADWPGEADSAPAIRIRAERGRRERGPAPGPGDRVLLKVEPSHGDEGTPYSGRVIKVLPKNERRLMGLFRANPDGDGGRVVPIDRKGQAREIALPAGAPQGGATDGDLVSVEIGRDAIHGLRIGRVRERLGAVTSESSISLIALHSHDIPHVFPEAAIREAEAAQPAGAAGRADWREVPFVTIDPADAKDHDDAVYAEADPDPDNPGGFVLFVAIADVAAYVRPGSALDREALKRGHSVYFPDRVVPMLPEALSNDLCSLKPGVERAALAMRAVIAADGRKLAHTFHRVRIRSAAKLAYPMAQKAIDGHPDEITGPLLEPVLKPLWGAYAALKRAREARGTLELDLPERKLVLDAKGRVADVIVPDRLHAHRLIEEFMILANVAAAETLEKARIPLLYRIHDQPTLEKMQSLRDFLDTIGITLPKQGAVRPDLFNRILARVKETPHAALVNEVVLRSQSQAEYSPENIGHFGLHLRRYAHFTSPIRRYADLVVHRGLVRAMGGGADSLPETTTPAGLKAVGEAISGCERRAIAAERETVDRLIAHFLADQLGASFTGRITGVTRAGLFVRLDRTGADGFVPAATLGDEYFRFEERAHALVGTRSREAYRLGDGVKVRLAEVAPLAGGLRFEMLSTGKIERSQKSRLRERPEPASTRAKHRKPGRGRAGRHAASRWEETE